MPRPRRVLQPAPDGELDAFAKQVAEALEHFANPDWLVAHSPLAAPYFLAPALAAQTLEPAGRGQVLQQVLLQCAAEVDPEQLQVLRSSYFKRDNRLDNVGVALGLHLSERTFYRLRIRAIQALADRLHNSRLLPLRSEWPPHQTTIGRAALLDQTQAALAAGRCVYLSGPSGIGKTNLGATLLECYPFEGGPAADPRAGRAFWYTLRAQFNDQVASLLFAFSHFLETQGAGDTWRQLFADRGVPNLERTLSLLRHDLHQLQSAPPLVCIDELDVLQEETSDHVRIMHVLDALRPQVPLLLIGQRVILEADEHLRLSGFDRPDLEAFLRHAGAALSPDHTRQLLSLTRGNPALIRLFANLIRAGDEPERVLHTLAHTPSMEALFSRIWNRLNPAERDLTKQLAVFRTAVPLDAWSGEPALDQLHERGVVELDGRGGVFVVPHLRRLAEDRAPTEEQRQLHQEAADLRETRAEYVAAMYHALGGQQPARAVWLWFAHRQQAIRHGQGAQALGLLQRIAPGDLPDERDRTALRIARAELLELAGQPEEALAEVGQAHTPAGSASRAYVLRLEGNLLEMQGRAEQAVERYRQALDTLASMPPYQVVGVHSRMGFLHMYRLHDVDTARREALLARANADAFLGDLESLAGRYRPALTYLLSAQQHAEESGHDPVVLSRIYSYLSVVNIKLGEYETAINYIDLAIECDRKLGDEVGPLYDLMNRSAAHTLTGRFEQGAADARAGLEVAERLRHAYLISGLAACLAEACCGLMQWDAAENYAQQSLGQEEPFFRASSLRVLGTVQLERGQGAAGIELFQAALDSVQQIDDPYTEAQIWHHLAAAYLRQGSVEPARAALETAERLYTRLELARETALVRSQLQALATRV